MNINSETVEKILIAIAASLATYLIPRIGKAFDIFFLFLFRRLKIVFQPRFNTFDKWFRFYFRQSPHIIIFGKGRKRKLSHKETREYLKRQNLFRKILDKAFCPFIFVEMDENGEITDIERISIFNLNHGSRLQKKYLDPDKSASIF